MNKKIIISLLENLKSMLCLPILSDEEDNSSVELVNSAIAWIESLPATEPLDPYTCELMVGDVVRLVEDSEKTDNLFFYARYDEYLNVIWIINIYSGSMYRVHRNEIVLTHRNGATIKEVGND